MRPLSPSGLPQKQRSPFSRLQAAARHIQSAATYSLDNKAAMARATILFAAAALLSVVAGKTVTLSNVQLPLDQNGQQL